MLPVSVSASLITEELLLRKPVQPLFWISLLPKSRVDLESTIASKTGHSSGRHICFLFLL